MDFDFSPEQEQLRGQVRRLLEDTSPLSETRQCLEGRKTFAERAYRGLAELGVLGATVPELYGGVGAGPLELCVAAEEIGRSLASVPALSSLYLCAEAIRLFGSLAQKERWLPGLASGEIIGACVASKPAAALEHNASATTFHDGRLHGCASPVLDGAIASLLLVFANSPDRGRPTLVLCDLSEAAAERKLVHAIDPSRSNAEIVFRGARAEALNQHDSATKAYETLRDRAAIFLAFEQVGGADRALWMARDYALQRRAFGRPIGANQAIKHKLVDMFAKTELARAHAYYGAWALASDAPELPLAAAGARSSATEAFSFAAQENIQVHGGIGFTWESDCQLFYRRARHYALVLGPPHEWKDRIARALCDGLAA